MSRLLRYDGDYGGSCPFSQLNVQYVSIMLKILSNFVYTKHRVYEKASLEGQFESAIVCMASVRVRVRDSIRIAGHLHLRLGITIASANIITFVIAVNVCL